MRRSPELLRAIVARLPRYSASKAARRLVTRANAERDARNYAAAAVLYEEALRLVPDQPRFQIQFGHMYKEAGDLAGAEQRYLAALLRLPDDPDLAMQLGHLYKLGSRPDEAEIFYRRATELRSGWEEAERELATVRNLEATPLASPTLTDVGGLAAELLPSAVPAAPSRLREGFEVRRLGATRARTRGGYRRVLRGVEAIRGFVVSSSRLTDLSLLLDDQEIRCEPLRPFTLPSGQIKYVFNIWHDFANFTEGMHQIELRTSDVLGLTRSHRQMIDILAPRSEADYPDADTVVAPTAKTTSLEAAINARPSMIRPAERALVKGFPRTILVQRVDQLGDLACSVLALQRLRTLYPDARIVGLVTAANVDLAHTLGTFDDVVVAVFDTDPSGRRTMSLEAQEALRQTLAPYRFDIAIDLGETVGSRPLLLLSGARLLYGFKDRECPWLTAGFELNTHDPANHHEMAAHARKMVALVDGLAAIVSGEAARMRRADLSRAALAEIGIAPDERYVVLHTGARLPYSRWPAYQALAKLLEERTALKIVILSDDPPSSSAPLGERVVSLGGRMAFDRFDALLSFAAVFVGNDSGPKHLASLRGTPVVSLHMARLNWNEWGQSGTGTVISRRVPCAGCGIGVDAEECGKDFACIRHISPEEVLGEILRLIAVKASGPSSDHPA